MDDYSEEKDICPSSPYKSPVKCVNPNTGELEIVKKKSNSDKKWWEYSVKSARNSKILLSSRRSFQNRGRKNRSSYHYETTLNSASLPEDPEARKADLLHRKQCAKLITFNAPGTTGSRAAADRVRAARERAEREAEMQAKATTCKKRNNGGYGSEYDSEEEFPEESDDY
jgi:hypothetical protein